MYSSSRGLSGTYVIFFLQAIGSLVIEMPSKSISPQSIPIMPRQDFNVVVFLAPFGASIYRQHPQHRIKQGF
jgi:hypothetical protein